MKFATGVLIRRVQAGSHQLLLGRKASTAEVGANTFSFPGGKKEKGETFEECAIRETREETGLILNPALLTFLGTTRFHVANDPYMQVQMYQAYSWQGTLKRTSELEPFWFPLNSIPYDQMLEGDRYWLPELLSGKPFTGCVYYKKEGPKEYDRMEPCSASDLGD